MHETNGDSEIFISICTLYSKCLYSTSAVCYVQSQAETSKLHDALLISFLYVNFHDGKVL